MSRYILISCVFFSLSSVAYAMPENEVKMIVTDSVLELCGQGSLTEKGTSIQIKREDKITTVLLKKLVDIGLDGKAEFSRKEWAGIQPLLPESLDSKAYTECVKTLTPIFLEKYSTPNSDMQSPN
jgi:hypothetical protein